MRRRVLLAAVTPSLDYVGHSFLQEFPCYAVHRLHAALKTAELDAEVAVVEVPSQNMDDIDAAIERFQPDVLGCSAYVWSFPKLLKIAERTKRAHPECFIVFGGPSAAPAMFELPPFRSRQTCVDALAVGEGETTLCEIVAAWPRSREALSQINGLYLPAADGWEKTPVRKNLPPLDSLASPYQLGLMPKGRMAYLEISRGCPFECLFCSWDMAGAGVRIMSSERLQRELKALGQHDPELVYLIDAGLNLNLHAFNNLRRAEEAVDVLSGRNITCELSPVGVRRDHIEFLARAQLARLGVGVQSLNPDVLSEMHRPLKARNLCGMLEEVAAVGNLIADVEIIMGLPGDSPESFRNTLDTVRDMPCNVRVFQAIALPGALLDRARAELAIKIDPYTLAISSCRGWSPEALEAERERLSQLVADSGQGYHGRYWWFFEPITASTLSRKPPGLRSRRSATGSSR